MGFTGGHTGDERHAGEQRTFSEWSEGCVRGQTSQIFVAETSVDHMSGLVSLIQILLASAWAAACVRRSQKRSCFGRAQRSLGSSTSS